MKSQSEKSKQFAALHQAGNSFVIPNPWDIGSANAPGARFDHEYYRTTHMPLVKDRMGDSCKSYTIDKGLAGSAPGTPAIYVGMCHIFCDSVEVFQKGFGPHAQEIMCDVRNYTNLTPVMQISEVIVG